MILVSLMLLASIVYFSLVAREGEPRSITFDGERAYEDVRFQVSLGPRLPGSPAHARTVDWLVSELERYGWQAEIQEARYGLHSIRKVAGKRKAGEVPWVVLGAHYDSRLAADKDPDPANRSSPVPGANDGASGVAVLLELARVLPADMDKEIWLVFFDAEDNGGIEDWDWILGSQAFVPNLSGKPDAVVILDMIGDADLNIHFERNSDLELSKQIWAQAARLGYEEFFIPTPKYAIIDDHVPFLRADIPAVDVIDFDYPFHHTISDTLDKVSPASLQIVGDTILAWLQSIE